MTHIKHTKKFCDRVLITNSSLYGKHSNKNAAEHAARVTSATLHVLDQHVLIPDDVRYVITKIRNSTTMGQFCPLTKQVLIDSRVDDRDLIRVICHESVHVDQVSRGDLSWNNADVVWQGVLYRNCNQYSVRQYRATPWEAEAFDKQEMLARMVEKTIFG